MTGAKDRTIVELHVATLDVPLFSPFGIAGGAQAVAENLLVTVVLADGTRGYGEAAPLPAFNGETQARAREAIDAARSALIGEDAGRQDRIAAVANEATKGLGSARCAIETAALDAATKREGVALVDFYGGAARALETDITLPLGTVEEARDGAGRAHSLGFSTLKIKIGSGDLDLDAARVFAAMRESPSARLLLDGNGGMGSKDAIAFAAAIEARGIRIALFEQPTPGDDLDALAAVAEAIHAPVAADESAKSAADVALIARSTRVRAINVKLMKCGLEEARSIALAARTQGLELMIGGMIETRLAMGTSACFAAGLGGFAHVDLDTPLFLEVDPFEGGYEANGPALDLRGVMRGHGLSPRSVPLPRARL